MTQRAPDNSRLWRNIAWYAGTTLLAVVVSVVAITAVQENDRCGTPLMQWSRTTTPNPLDLLTKPIPTPGAPTTTSAPTTLADGTVCR